MQEKQPSLTEVGDRRAVQILAGLPPEERAIAIQSLPVDRRNKIYQQARLSHRVAGGWMNTGIITVKPTDSTKEAIALVRVAPHKHHVVVTGEDGKYIGVIHIEDLLTGKKLAELISSAPSVDILTPVEKVVEIFRRQAPDVIVVTVNGIPVGVIGAEESIRLLDYAKDLEHAKQSAMSRLEHVYDPVTKAFRNRVPWLIVYLFVEFISAGVINIFQSTLKTLVLLAVLLPIVPGEAGSVTTQTMAVIIRGMATGELKKVRAAKLFAKELAVAILDGIVVGVIGFIFTYLWKGNMIASLALALATPVAFVLAAIAGAAVPIGLKKMGFDPAASSSVILTTLTDAIGFSTFLGTATILIHILGA
ncbi:MAG: magnesium transporter [Candidatus Diapherotrites archaeon]|nr:magnesium transporter [Candidatus Diapherotrites archaeon]